MKNNTHVVIMAGGIGSRFWPISTPEFPKQFIDILGVGKTLIQLTVERFMSICPIENMWVVTNEKYADIVKKQIPSMPDANILKEPEARNTAPCIAYACWKIKKQDPAANIVVSPSDAIVMNVAEYQRIISKALDFSNKNDSIVTIGIKPTRPETGYGYIAAKNDDDSAEVVKVECFKEKPSLAIAEEYLRSGNYFWNAGIFVWNVRTIEKEIRAFQPSLAAIMDELSDSLFTENEDSALLELFPKCDKISIDYAVMEKSQKIYTISGDFGWSDLGSWGSVLTHISTDANGNAVVGDNISLYECNDCIVSASNAAKIVVQGLNGYIVAEKDGRILICSLKDEQRIKEFSK